MHNFEKFNVQYILQGERYSYIKDKFKKLHSFYREYGISKKYLKDDYDIEDINTYKIEVLCDDKMGVEYCLSLRDYEYEYSCVCRLKILL